GRLGPGDAPRSPGVADPGSSGVPSRLSAGPRRVVSSHAGETAPGPPRIGRRGHRGAGPHPERTGAPADAAARRAGRRGTGSVSPHRLPRLAERHDADSGAETRPADPLSETVAGRRAGARRAG